MTDKIKIATTYSDLPQRDRYQGTCSNGEIEIVVPDDDNLPIIYSDNYMQIVEDQVIFPDSSQGKYLRLFTATESAGEHGVVGLPRFNDQFALIRIFRHPTRSWELELPRGVADPGCSSEENIRREIKEELGVDATSVNLLGTICPNTGLLASRNHAFEVILDEAPNPSTLDRQEAIQKIELVSKDELIQSIANNEIRDSYTLSTIMLAIAKGIL